MLLSTDKAVMSYSGHLKYAQTEALHYTSLWILRLSKKKTDPQLEKGRVTVSMGVSLHVYNMSHCFVTV